MKSDSLSLRTGLLAATILAAAGIIVTHRAEALQVLHTLTQGTPAWIFAAVCLQGAFYYLHAILFRFSFQVVGVRSETLPLLALWFRSVFLNTVAPTLGAAAFIDDAARRGESPVRAAAGTILVKVADMGTLLLVVAAGLAYLGLRHDLTGYELTACLVLAILVAGWAGALLIGLWNPSLLTGFLDTGRRIAAFLFRFARRPAPLPEDWAKRSTQEMTDCARLLQAEPRRLLPPIGVALIAHLVDILSLYALLLAFHAPVSPGVLTAGFAVGILFWVVSLTPEGIGAVEGAMALTFASLGVPLVKAAAVSLAFRGLAYYLPLIFGIALAQIPRRFSHGVDANASSSAY